MTELSNGQILSCIAEVKLGNTRLGLQLLESAVDHPNRPKAKAWYGYCLAREKKEYNKAIALCKDALKIDPREGEIYLALGRIYILLNRRKQAIAILKQGLKVDHSQDSERLLETIGVRNQPVFSFLKRRNLLNVTSGRLLSKIRLRWAS